MAWGAQAIVTQSLLLREAIVLMFGSEFAWGVVLFAWLFGVAVGAAVGGWAAERLWRPQIWLVTVLLTLSVAACVELWVFRGARAWLGVAPGELLPLPKTALAAMLLVSPVGALLGMAFPLACCVGRPLQPRALARADDPTTARVPQPGAQGKHQHAGPVTSETPRGLESAAQGDGRPIPSGGGGLQFGHVYALESAGSLIGGALFSFWAVEHLSPIQTALICGAITAAASAGLLAAWPFGFVGKCRSTGTKGAPSLAQQGVGDGGMSNSEYRITNKKREIVHSLHSLFAIRYSLFPRFPTPSFRRDGAPPRTLLAPCVLALVAVAAVLVALVAGDALDRRLVDRRWRDVAPGFELLAEAESKYQNLAVGRRGGQYTLYCDGQVSTDFPDPYTFAPSAHFWLCQHPSPRNVLVLGGGVEGLLIEILRHPVEHIDYVEPDPRQIELVKPYLAPPDRDALTDPRVTVHHLDARYYIKTQRDRFDLVIARLPEPTSAQRARFYTDEFYGELRRSMTGRSVLCMTAAAAPGELSAASREYLASIRATLRRHFQHIVIGWGHPAQVLAATAPGLLSTDPTELAARYTRRGVESELFHPAWFDGATDWLEAGKLARRAADLDQAVAPQISTDLRPSIYVQRLVLWEAATSAGRQSGDSRGGVIERLRSINLAELAAALAVVGAITLVICRLRRRAPDGWANGTVVLSIGSTGFATMALSIVWLFAFQNLYGYVYQRIGWIIAVFMGGLVIGCALGSRRSEHRRPNQNPERKRRAIRTPRSRLGLGSTDREISQFDSATYLWRRLVLVDVLLALLALSVPLVLPTLAALQTSPATFVLVEWCILVMVAVTGLLGGAAFPLAGRLQLGATGRAGAAAGSVVGADHAGACFGALLCGILLVPVYGTAAAAFLLAGMKLSSAVLLVVGHVTPRR